MDMLEFEIEAADKQRADALYWTEGLMKTNGEMERRRLMRKDFEFCRPEQLFLEPHAKSDLLFFERSEVLTKL